MNSNLKFSIALLFSYLSIFKIIKILDFEKKKDLINNYKLNDISYLDIIKKYILNKFIIKNIDYENKLLMIFGSFLLL